MALNEDANDVEKLYEYGERLNEAKEKSKVFLLCSENKTYFSSNLIVDNVYLMWIHSRLSLLL